MTSAAPTPDRRSRPRGPCRPDRGFTLVEVLIAATIAMIAITGLATLQILSLRAATSALQRSQATALAYEMLDRLRLNRGESGRTGTALAGSYDGLTLCHSGQRAAGDNQSCGIGAANSVTGTDIVALDLRDWWSALDTSGLPNWYAGILRTTDIFTVAVQWDNARAADAAEGTATPRTSCLGSQLPDTAEEVCVMTQL